MAISLDEIKAALDSFAAASMAAAGVPPMAVGQEGTMLATGAMDYIKGMFANVESALASQIGLAEIDAQLQQANLQAAVEREKIALGYAQLDAQKAYQQGLLGIQQQQIGLQKEGLNIYQDMIKKANDIENLTQSLLAKKYSKKPGTTDYVEYGEAYFGDHTIGQPLEPTVVGGDTGGTPAETVSYEEAYFGDETIGQPLD
jgi:multidrug efflux pump subunit AcrA (membrane-fusion protein)